MQNVWRIQRLGLRLRQDWAVHSEPLLCVGQFFFFFTQPFPFFPVSEVVVNAFGMTQAGVCVHVCLSVQVCLYLYCVCLLVCFSEVAVGYLCLNGIAGRRAQRFYLRLLRLLPPLDSGLTRSSPLPVIAVVALCSTELLVDLWQEQNDVNK